MSKEAEEKIVNIKIDKIKELSFRCDVGDDLLKKIDEKKVTFGIGTRLIPNPGAHEFSIALIIKYEYIDGERKIELCSYEIETTFKILEYANVIKIDKNKVNIDDNILLNFISITIGAIRGMLALKTSGTVLNSLILPMLNPKALLNTLKEVKNLSAK